MSGYARVDSVDALQTFRTALVKFAEQVSTSLSDAESEMQRVLVWLETEANTYWSSQIRKRHEIVERCKDAVRQKKLYKSPTGSTQSAVEEEKALRVAMRRLEEAEEKLKNVKRYAPRLQKEIAIYKGGVQRLATTVSADIPVAVSRLNKMIAALVAYQNLTISGAGVIEEAGAAAGAMARAVGELVKDDLRPLREKTARVDRKSAKPGDVRLEQWSDGLVSERERERITKLDAALSPAAPDQRLLVEQNAWQSPRIYLERVAAKDSDSGWFLGRGDGEEGNGFLEMTVQALLEARPDLKEVVELPVGFLVVVDVSGITAVLDERGVEVWGSSGQ